MAANATMTGGQALMETLLAHGVEIIFGNPGTTESPLLVALEEYPRLRYILALQEASVMAMADSYARASGRATFVNIHIAPGLANALSGLYNAFRGGTPMVVTAGQSDTRLLMHDAALSGDLTRMARQYTKWSHEILHPADVPVAVRRAFKIAHEPPTGPVFLSLPWNVLDDSAAMDLSAPGRFFAIGAPAAEGLDEAARLLASAARPALIVGDRVAQAGATRAAVALAERLGAPVFATSFSEVNFPANHPLFMGLLAGGGPGRALLDEADVILGAGATLFSQIIYTPRSPLPAGATLIQLDNAGWEIGKTLTPALGLLGDVRAGLEGLIARLGENLGQSQRRDQASAASAKRRSDFQARARSRWDDRPIAPERLMSEIATALPPDAILVDEAISHSPALMQAVEPSEPGRYYRIRGGAIGWGLPAALGVALARPEQPVVAVVGDGSSMYTIQALWSALHHRLPVTWVICNNGTYRVLKVNLAAYLGEGVAGRRFIGMDLTDPELDFARIAGGFGVRSERVERPEDLRPALERAIAAREPVLLDVVIDGSVQGVADDPRQLAATKS